MYGDIMNSDLLKKVEELYYDLSYGLLSPDKFYQKVKLIYPNITKNDINEFVNNQQINEVMKEHKRPKEFSSIKGYYNGDVYEMDIIIYDRYSYYNYKYILVVIDVYSRFLQCRPLKTRYMTEILHNMKDIFEVMPPPYKLKADNEFNTVEFNKYMKEKNVILQYSDPYEMNKNPIVERVNRTIARNLQKIRVLTKSNNWIKYLNDVVINYNDTQHKTTKETPNNVWNNLIAPKTEIHLVPNDLKIGDKVRVIIHKNIFGKGDEIKYSPEIYTIVSLKSGKFILDNDKGYKEYELKKTNQIIMNNEFEPKLIIPKKKKTIISDVEEKHIIHGMTRASKRPTKENKKDDYFY